MSELSALKKIPEIQQDDTQVDLKTDLRAERTKDLRKKASSIGGLKITSVSAAPAQPQTQSQPQASKPKAEEKETFDLDEESVLVLSPAARVPMARIGVIIKAVYIAAGALTAVWVVYSLGFIAVSGAANPNELGGMLAGMLAPPAMLWLLLSVLHRRSDVHQYSQALRTELQSLLFPSAETGQLINKDIERLCAQAAEISSASKTVLKSLQRARQGLRVEMRDFSGVSKKAEFHIDRLAESLQEKAAKLKTLTDEIEQRTASIDAKAQAGAEAWDQATLKILERAGEMESSLG